MTIPVRFRIVGRGRAGGSLAGALTGVGWHEEAPIGRGDDPAAAAADVDLVVIATPDGSVQQVAAAIEPNQRAAVAHLAGSLGLDVLAPHPRRAAVHPLVSLPNPEIGAHRLASGAWFAVAGDPIAQLLVDDLGGHRFEVADEDRAAYHATAAVASNHLVSLMGQVERLAAGIGVPVQAYLDLARGSLDNVMSAGAAASLTGPVARGDWNTVARHLAAIAPGERAAYLAMAREAARLAGRDPADLPSLPDDETGPSGSAAPVGPA